LIVWRITDAWLATMKALEEFDFSKAPQVGLRKSTGWPRRLYRTRRTHRPYRRLRDWQNPFTHRPVRRCMPPEAASPVCHGRRPCQRAGRGKATTATAPRAARWGRHDLFAINEVGYVPRSRESICRGCKQGGTTRRPKRRPLTSASEPQ